MNLEKWKALPIKKRLLTTNQLDYFKYLPYSLVSLLNEAATEIARLEDELAAEKNTKNDSAKR